MESKLNQHTDSESNAKASLVPRGSYTPGPWEYGPTTGNIYSDNPSTELVACDVRNKKDGYLIASAPELLEAVLHLKSCHHCAVGSLEDCTGGQEALKAIRKATGEML